MLRKKLFLIDGNAYAYRAYYAVPGLNAPDGRPVGAVYGFVRMLNKLKEDARPDYLGACFDLKGPTLRHKKYSEYKIQRKPMPDDLQAEMLLIKEIVCAYNIPIFELSGYEADDIIATLAVRFKAEVDVYIASGDKDMLQLVDEYVKIYSSQKEDNIIDGQKVAERYKVSPSQITDLLALTGDSSDNIPGVPGIGLKTAAELLGTFGSLEKILENTRSIPQQKRRQLLEEFSEQARLSKDLATVVTSVPLEMELAELKIKCSDSAQLKKIFQELGFKSFYRSLLEEDSSINAVEELIEIIDSKEKLDFITDEFSRANIISFSIPNQNDDSVFEISHQEGRIIRICSNPLLPFDNIKKVLNPAFLDKKIVKVGFDIKAQFIFLEKLGLCIQEPFFDIMIAAYLLEPGELANTFMTVSDTYLGRVVKESQKVCAQLELHNILSGQLKEKGLWELFSNLEMPLLKILAQMERIGICVDRNLLFELGEKIDIKLKALTENIYKISGGQFNINSPKQLSEVLFNKLKLPMRKKGKSGPSTNVDVLKQLSDKHPLPQVILEYRELAKLKSTYVTGMLELVNPQTCRVHTSFNQAVTATGRLSSSSPNLQNIPARTETGRQIRGVFVSRACDWRLVSADYSQIELRILAHLAKDENLIKAFRLGLDIHTFTASLIFGVAKEDVDEKMRVLAKRVNFGIIYGMGAYGLARDIGVSNDEAKRFIEEYFHRYPAVKVYMEKQIEQARANGYVTTLLNRRRYIPNINSNDPMQRGFGERIAMNAPIQGSAADLIKMAMIVIDRVFNKEKLKAAMILQVHDELVFDAPDDELTTVKQIVTEAMENVLALDVPVKVGIKIGKNWKDME